MPKLKEVFAQADYEKERIPDSIRRGFWDIVFVWSGYTLDMASFMAGIMLGLGLTFLGMGAVSIISIVVIAGLASGIFYVSQKTGLTSALLIRHAFGVKGAIPIAILMAIIFVFWQAFNIAWPGDFARDAFGWPFVPVVVISGIIYGITAYIGFEGLKWLSRITVPLFFVMCVFFVWISIDKVGWSGMMSLQPSGEEVVPIGVAVTALVGSWALGTLGGGDVARFAKSGGQAVGSAWLGIGFMRGFAVFAGAMTAIAFATASPGEVLALYGGALAFVGFLIIWLLEWTTADNNAYGFGLILSGAGARFWSKKTWVVVNIVIGTGGAIYGALYLLIKWILLLGVIVPPIIGVVLAEYYVLNRSGKARELAKNGMISWRYSAIISWLIGTGFAFLYTNVWNVPYPVVVTVVTAFVLQLIIGSAIKQPSEVPGWNSEG